MLCSSCTANVALLGFKPRTLEDLSVFSTIAAAAVVLIASIAAYLTLFFENCISLFQKMSPLIGEIDIDILLVGESLRQHKVIVFH